MGFFFFFFLVAAIVGGCGGCDMDGWIWWPTALGYEREIEKERGRIKNDKERIFK